jgi:tRNA A-37 threonylcarbamoyl transferase component Bud32
MDRAAARHQFPTRLADAGGAGRPTSPKPDQVVWRGDEAIIRELYDNGFAALCQSANADRLGTPCGHYRVATIKSGPHRAVFRFELPRRSVFVKHFKARRWWDVVRNTLRGTQAEREARAAVKVAAAGIETICYVAIGREARGLFVGDSFLVSNSVVNVVPLDELVRDSKHSGLHTPAFRRELARSLGRLCGRLHRAGLVHRDLHPANLLAEVQRDGHVRLILIDLQAVRRRRRWGIVLRRGARARWDLFGLFNFFQNAGRSDRYRFLDAYLSDTSTSPEEYRSSHGRTRRRAARIVLAHEIESFCQRASRREQLRYDKKWQRSNRRLIVADSRGVVCRGLTMLGTDQVLELRTDAERLFRPDRVRCWLRRTSSERAAVVDVWAAGTALRCEAVERSRSLGWRDLLPGVRWSSMRQAWEMAHAMRRRGVSTPHLLFYLQTRSLSQVREILVSERSSRSVPLTTFLAHQFVELPVREKEGWINANARLLAGELARMHDFSLVHQSFSASDILVAVDPHETSIQIGGAERVERRRLLSRRAAEQALGQLNASFSATRELRRVHRLRFLKKYLGDRFATQWKSAWHAIAERQATFDARSMSQVRSRELGARRMVRAAGLLLAAVLALCGCNVVDRPVGLPVKYEVRCKQEQLLVLSDFKLQKDHELIRELCTLREQEAQILELPLQRDPVVVYLFNDETVYRKYMAAKYPKLPRRSAYFIGSPTELSVFTHWGLNVREDLRHEYTHGLLHSAMKRVPLWLDEGLAEYFEISGPQPGGINREYATKLSALLAQGWRPNIKRLEGLPDDAQMRRSDYQEAWAWVHFMLNGSPQSKHVLLSYLKDLRTNPNPKPISKRLAVECPDYQELSMSYMSRLAPERQVADAL